MNGDIGLFRGPDPNRYHDEYCEARPYSQTACKCRERSERLLSGPLSDGTKSAVEAQNYPKPTKWSPDAETRIQAMLHNINVWETEAFIQKRRRQALLDQAVRNVTVPWERSAIDDLANTFNMRIAEETMDTTIPAVREEFARLSKEAA